MSQDSSLKKWIEISIPDLSGKEKYYLDQCIKTNYLSSIGPLIEKFEDEISSSVGLANGSTTTTSSGTSALHLSMLVAGVNKGDLVIIPSYTFIATANAISHAGAFPWLLDIDSKSLTIDPIILYDELAKNVVVNANHCIHKETGQRVAALVPVFSFGHPANMDKLGEIAKEFKIPLITDAAAAIGSKYKNLDIGPFSDLTCFSFNGNKSITCGGGGAICSPNKDLVNKAKHLGSTAKTGPNYVHDQIGYNYRMINTQAAIGLAQIERLTEIIYKKREIAKKYSLRLKIEKVLDPLPEMDWATSSCWLSGFVINESSLIKPKQLINHLNKKFIRAKEFWRPIHIQQPYKDALRGNLKVTNNLWERIIILPSSFSLTFEEQEYVITTILDYIN